MIGGTIMSTYMKTNALNTAFQLLKVIASGKLLQEQITEAETEMHIHFDQKQLLTANSALLDLLEKIKTETAYKMKNDTDLLNSYFRKITIAQKDYENVSLFLFLTEPPAEYLDIQTLLLMLIFCWILPKPGVASSF